MKNIILKNYKDEPKYDDIRIRDTGSFYRLEIFTRQPIEGDLWILIREFSRDVQGQENAILFYQTFNVKK